MDSCLGISNLCRIRFYQTCQTGTRCPNTQGLLDLDSYLSECKRAFGFTKEEVSENVKYTNAYYGGNNPQGSRIIWPNGSIDPWHNLSVLEPPNQTEDTIYVKGASHCAWIP
eukprot:UN30181